MRKKCLSAQGASYSAINTALPDLVSLYGSSTASLSFTFVASALGRVCVAMALGSKCRILARSTYIST